MRWRFDNGDIIEPLHESLAKIIASERDVSKLQGERLGRAKQFLDNEAAAKADDAADAEVNRLRNTIAAQRPRPNARKPLKGRIEELMRAERQSGVLFKTFLERWGREPIEDLSLVLNRDSGRYEISDGEQMLPYAISTLTKMWSKR